MPVQAFIDRVRRSRQQQAFYHFTDTRNLPSIRLHGLLSHAELIRRGLNHVPGGNALSHELDQMHGTDDHVHLCFRANHGMRGQILAEGRIAQACWVRIDPAIILLPEVSVTLDNAAMNGVEPQPLIHALPLLDQQILYDYSDWNDPVMRQRLTASERCELLIPNNVPTRYILP